MTDHGVMQIEFALQKALIMLSGPIGNFSLGQFLDLILSYEVVLDDYNYSVSGNRYSLIFITNQKSISTIRQLFADHLVLSDSSVDIFDEIGCLILGGMGMQNSNLIFEILATSQSIQTKVVFFNATESRLTLVIDSISKLNQLLGLLRDKFNC